MNLLLLGGGIVCWTAVLWLFLTRSPVDDPDAQVLGAVLLGLAFALPTASLSWLAAFSRRGIAYQGDWLRAARRATWLGVGAALFVLLRSEGAFSVPVALFVVAMVLFVEVTLSVRR
jgi:hypothetical protein